MTLTLILTNAVSTWAAYKDPYSGDPAKYFYAVAFQFYETDLRRTYQITHTDAYGLIGKSSGRAIHIFWDGEEGYHTKGRVAGILDTDDPEIKTVVLMFGWSGEPISNWVYEESCWAMTESSIKRQNEELTPASCQNGNRVWGRSINHAHVFDITEADWDYCFNTQSE